MAKGAAGASNNGRALTGTPVFFACLAPQSAIVENAATGRRGMCRMPAKIGSSHSFGSADTFNTIAGRAG
jgi:hypothetical protein